MSLYLVSQRQEKQGNNAAIIIPAEREKRGSQRVCTGNRLYEMDVIILETEARFRGSASGIGANLRSHN